MPVINCPICEYHTDDINAVAAAAQLNIHALTHSAGARPPSDKQKPPRIDRPSVTRGTTEEEWNTFTKKWSLFKRGTDIPASQITTQLWKCCDNELEDDLFKDINNIDTVSEDQLLAAIRRLAVISTATSIRKTELLSLKQDHGQPIRSFAAQVKGKAQVCAFAKECPSEDCHQNVDYTEDIVKYVIISGICDEEIKKDILGDSRLDDLTLNETISLIGNKEMAIRAMSSYSGHHDSTNTAAVHQRQPNKPTDHQKKLQLKSKCKNCDREIQKFKMRYGKLKEFDLCIECWRAKNSNKNKDNNSALFDVVGGLSTNRSEKSNPSKTISRKANIQPLLHHIFDGSYGWMIKDSKNQPSMNLRLSINKSDYEQLNLPIPDVNKSGKVKVITDTGAQSSLMGIKAFRKCGFDESLIVPAKKKMFAANNEGINILGAFFGRLCGHDKQGQCIEAPEMIYVTDSTDLFYLSRQGMERLKIISSDFPSIEAAASITISNSTEVPAETKLEHAKDSNKCECLTRTTPPPRPSKLPFEPTEANSEQMKQWLLNRFASSTFNQCSHQPLPMMKGPAIKIHINPDATPSAVHTPAQIPIHWRDTIIRQLDADVALGVIEKVPPNTPTSWCHRAFWVRKPDGSPRRVVDFQALNRQCQRDTHHTVPPFQQARAIPPSTIRSVTDAWNGYHSVPVRPEDRNLLTFITEFGRYRYCVLPQGFVASGDGYTYRYDEIIADIPRKSKIVDDTVLWDGISDIEEHWWRIIDYLQLMGTKGITLNPSKFQFSQRDIEFGGFSITSDEVKPLAKYLNAIRSFPTPKSITDIRSWFGLVNQVSHYNRLIEIMEPFRPLLSPKMQFVWTEELDMAFEKSKIELIHAIEEGVSIYDPKRRTCLCPDWSKTGIGYWLRQKYCDCKSEKPDCCEIGWKITLAGSRFLKGPEKRYAPIEGEALAISYALEDTKYFTLGCDNLIVATDHKPLVKVFGDRALDEITKKYVISSLPNDAPKLPPDLEPFLKCHETLTVVDDVILVGGRALIPEPLRDTVCKILHSAHQGVNAMNERARATVFWPGITNDIKKTRGQCQSCWRNAPSQQNLPPMDPFVPTYPFEAVATDYCDFNGSHYLITVDRFSNWPEVIKVKPNSANSGSSGLIKSLRKYFATFGVPEEVSSDGGPEFSSKETETFFTKWGIRHRQSSAYNPRSNGRAEVAVKSMKRLLSNNVSLSGDLDTDKFTQAILQFRNTPDPSNGISPAEIIFGRTLRDALPFHPQSQVFNNASIRPIWRNMWAKREDTLRHRLTKQTENLRMNVKHLPPLQEGDHCHIQNQTGRFSRKWDKTGVVIQVKGNDQYVIKVDGTGRLSLRNRKYLRKFQPLHDTRPLCLTTIPQITDSSKQASRVDEIPPNFAKPSTYNEVVNPESQSVVLIPPEVIGQTATPSISTPSRNEETDSQPPNNTETLPEVRKIFSCS